MNTTEKTVECPYCAEQISPRAKKCKHCGEYLDTQLECGSTGTKHPFTAHSKSANRFWTKQRIWFWAIAAIFILCSAIVLNNPSLVNKPNEGRINPSTQQSTSTTQRSATTVPNQSTARQLPPECFITKRNGMLDERVCDLEELCKDWVFYRARIARYQNSGDTRKANEARQSFQRINNWLSDYREEDVQACLARHGAG